MPFASALATLAALAAVLLGTAGHAVAAMNNVPRMERVAACSWDRPGHNPFMGDVVAAIDRYIDIPTIVRIKLKQRMQARQYDDLVDIRRDEISGRQRYEPVIRDMHFGLDRVCRQVTRESWTATMHERGLVYCEQGHCILVPTVCRNVSRIERRPTLVAGTSLADPPDTPLAFAPPAAGPSTPGADAPSPAATRQDSIDVAPDAQTDTGIVAPPWLSASGTGGGAGLDLGEAGRAGAAPWWPGWPAASGGTGGNGGGKLADGSHVDNFPGGRGHLPAGDVGRDNALVTAVPEPATWASLLAGLLVLGLVSATRQGRRRVAPH